MFDDPRFDHVLIYGAGLAGRDVHTYLAGKGHEVAAFLDRNTSFGEVSGLPVVTAQAWAEEHDPTRACVVVGLFNNNVRLGDIVTVLQQLGYGRVVSLAEFVRYYPDDQPFRYWLVDPRFLEANAGKIARLRGRLADESSRELLDAIVEFRTTGDDRRLPLPCPRQYFPDDLPPWPQPIRFIDCGAYTGDTVEEMRTAGLQFEAVATFEPNLDNYQVLTQNLSGLAAFNFPCGVSDGNRQVGFDGSLGDGGHLIEGGGEQVTCVRLDDALHGFAPTLIKMDIEGEEPAALAGAEKMLRRFRPNLAIATYHRAEHLWTIFEQLDGYELDYRYYLRGHAQNTFEVILYALRDG